MKVLIAGATGYLGAYVTREFKNQNYFTKAIVRDLKKFEKMQLQADEVRVAEVTNKFELLGCCMDVDVVFSSIGITKQKNGYTYMEVDYKANLNLLEEAQKSGVKKFIFVSVLNGNKLRHLKICEAKEKFVDTLKNSGMEYCIIRPTSFFSDMNEYYEMADKGHIFLFGNGNHLINPIDGEDLARVCVSSVQRKDKEILIGGPDLLTHNQIAQMAFSVSGKKEKITHIPDLFGKTGLFLLRIFTNSKFYGPLEFVLTVLSMDMSAPKYGNHQLKTYFGELKKLCGKKVN